MLNNVMNNALSGINAAQGGLSVISNNLANAGWAIITVRVRYSVKTRAP